MKQRVFAFLIGVCLAATPAGAVTGQTVETMEIDSAGAVTDGSCGVNGGDVRWSLDSDTGVLEIFGTGEMGTGEWETADVRSVIIHEGVTGIEEECFGNMDDLKSVTIGPDVKTIGSYAFWNSGIQKIEIPENVQKIGAAAFSDCESLTSVTIRSAMNNVEYSVFSGCTMLSELDLQGVNEIGDTMFSGCKSLVNVEIPRGVRIIGESAFEDCTGLRTITFPLGIEKIGDGILDGCDSLVTIYGRTGSYAEKYFEQNGYWAYYQSVSPGEDEKITVTFDAKGGKCKTATQKYNYGSEYGKLPVATRDGYIFVGWFTKPSGGEQMEETSKVAFDTTGTLYAHWVERALPKLDANGNVVSKAAQKITASPVTRELGTKTFKLSAYTNGDGALSYKSSNKKVASINKKGKVNVKNCGITTITVKAAATVNCKAASKKVKLAVNPERVTGIIITLKEKSLQLGWKKGSGTTGYRVEFSQDKKFQKNTKGKTFTTNGCEISKAKSFEIGKVYYFRIQSFKKAGKKTYYGEYSEPIAILVK